LAKTVILYYAGLVLVPSFQKQDTNGVRVVFGSGETLDAILTKVITAAGSDKVRMLRIFAHGSEGLLQIGLGPDFVTSKNAIKFKTLRAVLDDPSTIEIHGCEVAHNGGKSGSAGYTFMKALADATKASVTAADSAQLLTSADPADYLMEGTVYTFLPTP
jgi:hypothetical protein